MAKVTFTVSDAGQPIHSDATVQVRPRLFLEGNFFLDLSPGSPSAPELPERLHAQGHPDSVAVQLDQVLTALQAPERKNLQQLLTGLGTAFTHEPTAAEDADQDPDVQGETAGRGAQRHLQVRRRGGPDLGDRQPGAAGDRTARPLGPDRRQQQGVRRAAESRGAAQGPDHQLQHHRRCVRRRAGQPLADRRAARTNARDRRSPALAHLNESFPQLARFAIDARPGVEELPATIAAAEPWLAQARSAARPAGARRPREAAPRGPRRRLPRPRIRRPGS